MGSEDAFCLKWNDFHTSVTATFADLRNEHDLTDAIIVCEGQAMKAHKLILSACSGVFKQLFKNNCLSNSKEPVIMLWDVKAEDMEMLFNFMYEGQVNVAQEHLNTFLALAERLQVRGLTTSNDSSKNSTQNHSSSSSSSTTQRRQRSPNRTPAAPALKRARITEAPTPSTPQSHDEDGPEEVPVFVKAELKGDDSSLHISQEEHSADSYDQGDTSYDQYYDQAEGYAGPSGQADFSIPAAVGGASGTESMAKDFSLPPYRSVLLEPAFFDCGICGKVFRSSNSRNNHRSLYHRDQTKKLRQF